MELFIFARFHAEAGKEDRVEEAIRTVLDPTSKEAGCLSIHAFRSSRDARLFYVHARWQDEDAFERHIRLPHTRLFVETVEKLIDHPLDVTRAHQFL
ncbi:MAG TPA: putative quinol monooxygenase [Candidatus Acidoferrales bacterium]|nr:putative quinol monooxygenase [Candidatus Acidoferrales bacterium]